MNYSLCKKKRNIEIPDRYRIKLIWNQGELDSKIKAHQMTVGQPWSFKLNYLTELWGKTGGGRTTCIALDYSGRKTLTKDWRREKYWSKPCSSIILILY